jgi:hypothetical protein
VKYYLGAQVAHGLHLARIGALRNGYDGFRAEDAGGIGDGLAVITGGSGSHTPAFFLLRKLGEQVNAAPHLEGAQSLMVLVLYIDLSAQKLVEGEVVMERGPDHVREDAPLGLDDIR